MKRSTMRVISLLMLTASVGFVWYALGHPEGSFPWSNKVTYVLYGVYIAVAAGLFALSLRKN